MGEAKRRRQAVGGSGKEPPGPHVCEKCKQPTSANEIWCADCLEEYPTLAALKALIDEGKVHDSGGRRDGQIVWVADVWHKPN
jgi:hypothetical protein